MASLGYYLLLAAFVVCAYAAAISVAGARRRSRALIESGHLHDVPTVTGHTLSQEHGSAEAPDGQVVRAVSNALQRARGKLIDRAA